MAREKIIALGKKMTDRIPQKLGLEKITESDPEYYGLACVVSDEEAEVALAMDLRKPTTPEKIAKKMGKDVEYVRKHMRTVPTKCISCMRCVSMCSTDSRRVPAPMRLAAHMTLKKLCSERREPEFYL